MAAVLPCPPPGLRPGSRGCAGLTVGCWGPDADERATRRRTSSQRIRPTGTSLAARCLPPTQALTPTPVDTRPYLASAHAQCGRARQHAEPRACRPGAARHPRNAPRSPSFRHPRPLRPPTGNGAALRPPSRRAATDNAARTRTGRRHKHCPRIDLWCTCYLPGQAAGADDLHRSRQTPGTRNARAARQVHRQGGDVSRATARTRPPSARHAASTPTAPQGPRRAEVRGRLPHHGQQDAAPAPRVRSYR